MNAPQVGSPLVGAGAVVVLDGTPVETSTVPLAMVVPELTLLDSAVVPV
jgi:hypothetical protein